MLAIFCQQGNNPCITARRGHRQCKYKHYYENLKICHKYFSIEKSVENSPLEQAVGDGEKESFITFSVFSLVCFDSQSAMCQRFGNMPKAKALKKLKRGISEPLETAYCG